MTQLNYKNILFCAMVALFVACSQGEEYPIEPEITFVKYDLRSTNTGDSITLTFSYIDGDGDLGLKSDETSLPGNDSLHHVIYIDYFEKRNGEFVQILKGFSTDTLNYLFRIGLLTPQGINKAIKGEISVTLIPYSLPVNTAKEMKYSIYIIDRALHKSNVIETPIIQYTTPKQ